MELKFKIDGETGQGYVAAIDPTSGEHRKAAALNKGQEISLELTELVSADQISFGDVIDSAEEVGTPEPSTDTGGGQEQPAGDGGAGDTPADGEGGQAPADSGESGETPTTSAASEKPLYLISAPDGEATELPDGFELSGLETPDGKSLYHYESDTAGQSATGNVDGVSVYADADDNEKPVQPATPAEGQEAPQS